MRTVDVLSLSTRMFKTRPMRTFLTVLGVGVGIGTVLFLVSLGYGLQNIILSRIATADSLLTLDVGPGPSDELALSTMNISRIDQVADVDEVSRLKSFLAQVSINDLTTNTQVQAVDRTFFRLKGIKAEEDGALLIEGDPLGAVISSAGAKLFNLDPKDIVGKPADITLAIPHNSGGVLTDVMPLKGPYIIRGVVDDDDAPYLFIALDSIPHVPIDSFDQLKIKVGSNERMESVRDAVIQQGFIVSALSDIIDQANKIFRIVQIVLALFGLVALIVSAIGMFNTMTITLLERTNEIGIMRAIGITRFDIKVLFLVESMLMGFLGGVGGVMIGAAAGYVANWGINMLASRFGGTELDLFYIPVWFVVVIIGFSTFIGFATGIYPSRRASKLNPLDALRYK